MSGFSVVFSLRSEAPAGGGASPEAGSASIEKLDSAPGPVRPNVGQVSTRDAAEEHDAGASEVSIRDRLEQWKRDAESRDLDSYVGNYSSVVDYYRKPGAMQDFIRLDKQRAFARFSSITISIEVVRLDVEGSGRQGSSVVIIDKGWRFEGGGYSEGKVRQRITLQKSQEKWLISGEKDLKVYYVSN